MKASPFVGPLACAAALLGASATATAQSVEAPTSTASEPTRHLTWQTSPQAREEGERSDAPLPSRHAEERPFAFLLDPTTPSAADFALGYEFGAASGGQADRPLPASISVAGVTHTLSMDYGLGEHVAPFASIRILQPTSSVKSGVGGVAGFRWQLTNPKNRFRLTFAAAGFREIEGAFGTYGRLAASYDIDRLRIAGNVHAERVFAPGRDDVDVLVLAGLSYRMMSEMRVGIEYVGQDLEETGNDDGPEGGARHYLGPSLAFNLLADNLQLVAGTGFGLQGHATGLMGHVGTLLTF